MGRPTKRKVASRQNGAAQSNSKPVKGKKRAKKKSPPQKLVPVLGLGYARIDGRVQEYVRILMLPPTPKGAVRAFEESAVRHCMVREKARALRRFTRGERATELRRESAAARQ